MRLGFMGLLYWIEYVAEVGHLSSTARKRSRLLAAKYRSGMALDELRQAREMTQVHP